VPAILRLDTFNDTVLVVFALSTALMLGAAFGFRQAINAVKDCEDDRPPGLFVRWFVEDMRPDGGQQWRSWGIGGAAIGVWLGGGCIICLPVAAAIWALWVR
jgi:hypothetical protein